MVFKSVRRIAFLFVFLYFLNPSIGPAQKLSDTLKQIDQIFSEMNAQTPGAAVRVSRGDKVLYSKGFGSADLEHGIRVTDETIFEAGSVSKQFTATSILLLAMEGKLRLDDEVRKYIPEFPRYEKPVTIRHLVNHTSGVRDWGEVAALGGWPRGTRMYSNQLALKYIIRQEGLNYIPGDEYLYSNSNYTLMTIIVERVSGKSLPEFTEEYIFKPLGMKNTKWRNNFKEVVQNRAIGYDRNNNTYFSNMPFENTYGHAALLTNVRDLDIWNKSWKDSPLGGDELLKMRTEQGVLNDGEKIGYAAGVVVGDHNGHREVSHSGATAGYRCWLAYYPENDFSIVYLSNATYFPTVPTGKKIASIFLGSEAKASPKKDETPKTTYTPEAKDLAVLEGDYYSAECEGHYTITVTGTSVRLNDNVRRNVVLKPVSPNKFEEGGRAYEFRIYGSNKQIFVTSGRARNVRFVSR